MKLLISAELFYPSRLGGPANTLYWLAKGLVKSGRDVTVITTDKHIETGKVETDRWLQLYGIKIRYCHASNPFHLNLKLLRYAWKEMKKSDVVMLCDMFQRQIFPTALMAKLRRKPMVWSIRGELFPSALKENKKKLFYLKCVKSLFGNHCLFHATSEEEEQCIRKYLGDDARIVIVPNYMELPKRQNRELVEPPYFLYLGRIAPIKALDRLIDGVARSKRFAESDYVLKIAGGVEDQFQEYYQQLQSQIERLGLQGRVLFIGAVNGSEKYQTYADAHFLFLVSHSENFGNVVIESLSQGTPVVASTGTPWESLTDSHAGYWIDNTPEEIAECIDKILDLDDSTYQLIRENALKFGESYDVYKNIDKWLAALEMSIKQKQSDK